MSTHTADRAPLLRLGRTRAIARRSGALRSGLAIAVASFGCVQVLLVENGAAGTIVGGCLVALAAPLARGRRRALLATAGFIGASLALDDDAVALPGLAAVALLAALLVSAPAFRASGDPATRRLIVPAAGLLAIGLAADLARAGGQLAHPLAATLLVGAGLFAARSLRPWRSGAADDPEGRARAARIVAGHATDTLAPFTLRADKQFFFASTGTAFVAYRVVAGVALVSGDPVGDEAAFPALVAEFAHFSERRGWTLGVLGVSAQRLPLWRDAGLRAHYTGDEAIVDPSSFSLEGRAIRKVRQSVTRLERAGYSAQAVPSAAVDEVLAERIAEIAERWRGDRSETGFSMAFAGAAVDASRDDLYVIARDGTGEPRGFLHFGSVPGGRALSLSSMRRERDTPNGLNEFLICRALEFAREQGIERVSLNFAAFALLLDPPAPLDPLSRAERRVLGRVARRFQLERLLSFSQKFEPEWTPRYAAYPSVATLPRIALAAMLAEAYVTLPSAPWRARRA
jgi:lysyl-tRNA synthetase, class II